MARVVALIPDLLFGSRVQGQLTAAGHEVELVGDARRAAESLAGPTGEGRAESAGEGWAESAGEGRAESAGEGRAGSATSVLVVDLTDPDLDGAALLRGLIADGKLQGVSTLGFYAHVDPAVRESALAAGFDRVVPRSRMAREGAELVAALSRAW